MHERRAKADLKAATDPFVKGVLDGRQLALKVQTALIDFCTEVTPAGLPLPCSSPVNARLQYKTLSTRPQYKSQP